MSDSLTDRKLLAELIQNISTDFYVNLENSEIQKEYVKWLAEYRNIAYETLRKAKVFYIFDDTLFDELIPDELDREIIGVKLRNDRIYRERFVFPILSSDDRLVHWSGYDSESSTKYLFAKTPLVTKDKVFYNYNNVHHSYKLDVNIVVEGIFHSLRLTELSLKNNLGLLGKRMTDYHSRILNRFGLNILIPDNDEAGEKALKSWKYKLKTKIAVIKLRKEKDPLTGKDVTDIDDKLKIDVTRYGEFMELYNKIVEDSASPLFTYREYYF